MSPVTLENIDLSSAPVFVCRQCGQCCRWVGIVRIRPEEIDPIARSLGLAPEEFIARYTRLAADRRGLILTEAADGSCILLEDNACRIQAAKPQQCRDFPSRWNFRGFEAHCAGARPHTVR